MFIGKSSHHFEFKVYTYRCEHIIVTGSPNMMHANIFGIKRQYTKFGQGNIQLRSKILRIYISPNWPSFWPKHHFDQIVQPIRFCNSLNPVNMTFSTMPFCCYMNSYNYNNNNNNGKIINCNTLTSSRNLHIHYSNVNKIFYKSHMFLRCGRQGKAVIKNPHHARWLKWESVEAAMSSQPILRNSAARSLNAMISVGHTKVKSSG